MSVRTRRSGFTAMELMIAIGIIIVLGGILLVGLRSMTTGTKNGSTKIDLNNLRGMLGELEAVSKTDYQYLNTGWVLPIASPTTVKEGDTDRQGTVVRQTAYVYQRLRSVPANRDVMAKFPADKMMKWSVPAPVPLIPPNPMTPLAVASTTSIPILVDSWNNPMIFVPAQGMTGITVGPVTYAAANPNPSFQAFRSPDSRPYFASAGPDGDFSKGDDNVYSFEN